MAQSVWTNFVPVAALPKPIFTGYVWIYDKDRTNSAAAVTNPIIDFTPEFSKEVFFVFVVVAVVVVVVVEVVVVVVFFYAF
jgi:hypothetical protein